MPLPTDAPDSVVDALAPHGVLRAAINFGNPILATRCPDSGLPAGISVDLSRELAKQLRVPLKFVLYPAAGKVVETIASETWDVAFLAIDPQRARQIDYSAPYLTIVGSYAVRREGPIMSNAGVDSDGVRIVVGAGSAYDLFLTRSIKKATIVRAETSQAVVQTMLTNSFEVAAGVRQQLEFDLRGRSDLQLLDGRFMTIQQAIAIPKGRVLGLSFLINFVEDLKSSGFIRSCIIRHRIQGVLVADDQEP